MKHLLFPWLVLLMIACGGTTPTNPPGDAAADAAAFDGGACVRVSQEGTPCVAGQRSCDRVDPCCASTFRCSSGTWKLEGLACLLCQSQPCGNKTCQGGLMCIQRQSGLNECVPYPDACSREWTCGCVTKNLPPSCVLAPGGCTDASLPVTLSCTGS